MGTMNSERKHNRYSSGISSVGGLLKFSFFAHIKLVSVIACYLNKSSCPQELNQGYNGHIDDGIEFQYIN